MTFDERLAEAEAQLKRIKEDYTATKQPTIESVYGKPFEDLTPPAGYAWELGSDGKPEFRAQRKNELHLSKWCCIASGRAVTSENVGAPRLILRKRKRLVFDVIREYTLLSAGDVAWFRDVNVIRKISPEETAEHYGAILSEPRIEE